MLKYRFKGGLVVETTRISQPSEGIGRFKCLVRGYGHGSKVPRREYVLEATTPAIAARNALDKYTKEYGRS